MPIRTWKRKDGTTVTKRYDSIKGIDARIYKQQEGKRYRAKKKRQTQQPPLALAQKTAKTKKSIASSLPDAMIQIIKSYRELGLSVNKIAQHTHLTRFTVTKVLNSGCQS